MILTENINKVLDNIRSTGKAVTLVCATKTVPADIINLLPSYGLTIAGENKVQELLDKYGSVQNMEWHFIGQLQTNKVKYIIDKVTLIQSLDRMSLAEEIERQCIKRGKSMDALIEVNCGEESKGGIPPDAVTEFAEILRKCFPHINIRGIMSLMPHVYDAEDNKNLHLQMKELYDKLYSDKFPVKYLSIGMSGDYMTAIKYGANMVRLGSCLFGSRQYTE